MSSTTKQSRLIGCNLRPGQPRGGMTKRVQSGVPRQAAQAVIEAARVALEKRGFHHNPSPWKDMVFGKGVAARAEKERVAP